MKFALILMSIGFFLKAILQASSSQGQIELFIILGFTSWFATVIVVKIDEAIEKINKILEKP